MTTKRRGGADGDEQVLGGRVTVRHRLGKCVQPVEQLRDAVAEGAESRPQVGVVGQPRVRPQGVVGEGGEAAHADRGLGVHPEREAGWEVTEQLGGAAAGVPSTQGPGRAVVAVEVPGLDALGDVLHPHGQPVVTEVDDAMQRRGAHAVGERGHDGRLPEVELDAPGKPVEEARLRLRREHREERPVLGVLEDLAEERPALSAEAVEPAGRRRSEGVGDHLEDRLAAVAAQRLCDQGRRLEVADQLVEAVRPRLAELIGGASAADRHGDLLRDDQVPLLVLR